MLLMVLRDRESTPILNKNLVAPERNSCSSFPGRERGGVGGGKSVLNGRCWPQKLLLMCCPTLRKRRAKGGKPRKIPRNTVASKKVPFFFKPKETKTFLEPVPLCFQEGAVRNFPWLASLCSHLAEPLRCWNC